MSYTIYLTVDTGGPERPWIFDRNYTSNCSPMWRKAGANLAEMDGKLAADAEPILAFAIAAMRESPAEYKALNPPNGWGDYDGCIRFLTEIRDACVAHPKTTLEVSR